MFENVPTVSSLERQQVLAALDRLQSKLVQREEWTHSDNMRNLRETLQSPLFNHILTLQCSIKQLRHQVNSFPADARSDFSFSSKGQLVLSSVAPPPASSLSNHSAPAALQAPPTAFDLQKWIAASAKGRSTELVRLSRPTSGGLGFSVVGLNPGGSSCQGVFIKHVQPGGVAHRSGGLQERDQILVINGRALEPGVSQQEALSLLQGEDFVELVVARETALTVAPERSVNTPLLQLPDIDTSQWGHVEQMELVNDGSGLGFGIVGGKSGVVVRTLLPNSVAHRDGRLRTGDHILSIGSVPTADLSSEQVVSALQACGSRVHMIIARDYKGQRSPGPPPPPDSAPVAVLAPPPPKTQPQRRVSKTPNLEGYEIHEVSLSKKPGQSLGISIIGYNPLTSQDAVGVFVKSVVPGSAAEQNGNIRVHDRILALNGVSLHGRTNTEVLEVMKQTGQTVVLTLVRKKRALERSLDKVERGESRVSLKRSLELKSRSLGRQELSLGTTRASEAELRAKWEQALGPNYRVLVVNLDPVIEDDEELQKSSKLLPVHTVRLGVELDSFDGHHYVSSVVPEGPVDKHGELRPEDELLEVNDVQVYGKSRREVIAFLKEVPPPFTLVCCRLLASDQDPDQDPGLDRDSDSDSEPEMEYRPLYETRPDPEPRARDEASVEEIELKLSSMFCQTEQVLQPRPQQVLQPRPQQVLQPRPQQAPSPELGSDSEDEAREVGEEGEEGEDSGGGGEEEEEEEEELAMWSPDVLTIELNKDLEKGLGFSILDYQDPLDPGRCVMVVRSLVQGGSAERSGCLLPGDQVVWVNSAQLCDLSLSEAVDVLKTAPAGRVRLGIRKPLVESGDAGAGGAQFSLEDNNELELILDGGLPRYSSATPVTSDLSPAEEREMAVDEEVTRSKTTEEEEQRPPPPSWEEWRHSLGRGRGSEVTQVTETKNETQRVEDKPVTSDPESAASTRRDWSEADSELTLTDTDTESVRVVNTERRRRRGQAGTYPPTSDLPEREDGEGEETPTFSHWGPPRRVEVWVEPGQSLGLSIVGGRHVIKRLRNGEELKGIFIKQVLKQSPADLSQSLKTGDKILEVNGVDLRRASHEEAVNAIKSSQSPVVFVVQSLSNTPRPVSVLAPSYSKHRAKRTESPGRHQGAAQRTESPGRHQGAAQRTESPGRHQGAAQRTESPGRHQGAAQRTESPGRHQGAAQRTESPGRHQGAAQRTESPGRHQGAAQRTESPGRHQGAAQRDESPKPTLAPPPLRDPPPYRPPSQSDGGSDPDQAKGLV